MDLILIATDTLVLGCIKKQSCYIFATLAMLIQYVEDDGVMQCCDERNFALMMGSRKKLMQLKEPSMCTMAVVLVDSQCNTTNMNSSYVDTLC